MSVYRPTYKDPKTGADIHSAAAGQNMREMLE